MNSFDSFVKLQEKAKEIKQLENQRYAILAKKEEDRSEFDVVFLKNYEEKLTILENEILELFELFKKETKQITADKFLSYKLPPTVFDKKHAKSSTTIAVPNPRVPAFVTHWESFETDAASFSFPADIQSAVVTIPEFVKYVAPIGSKKGVHTHIATNIDTVLSKLQREISDTPFKFTQNTLSEFKGETDHLIYKNTNQNIVVYSFIEDKTIFDIPTPKNNESLVSWWQEDYAYEIGKSNVKREGKSIYHEITQFYGYLCDNSLRYGILTTYECTWFISRPQPTVMQISSPIACDGESPTLLQAYCYFLSLLDENHLSDRMPRVSPALKLQRSQTVEINQNIDTPAATKLTGGIPDDFSIEDISVSRVLGEGVCGSVYEWDYNGKPVAVKLCDYTKNKEGYKMMQQEVDVYKKLASLQGHSIPEFHFAGHISNFFIICTSRIDGEPCRKMYKSYQRQIDSICDEMRSLGVVHTDLRESNILLDKDKKIWIIDFGECDVIA